nr:FCD domain-containing protein [Azomonas macrocytogenes]
MHPDSAIFDYLEFRTLVEPQIAALAAQRASAVDLEVIRTCLARIEQAHERQEPSGEADADLHIAVYEASHNVMMLHVMRSISGMLRNSVFYSRTRLHERPELREILCEQHRAIVQAILDRDGERAREAVARHIDFTAKALREVIEADSRLEVSLRRLERGALAVKNP